MKKAVCVLTMLVVLCSLGSCQKQEADLEALQQQIAQSDLFVDTPVVLLSMEKLASVVELDISLFNNGSAAFYADNGETAEEYGLFQCNDAKSAAALVLQLETRCAQQTELYTFLAKPASLARIENATIYRSGVYVVYICAENSEAAKALVAQSF